MKRVLLSLLLILLHCELCLGQSNHIPRKVYTTKSLGSLTAPQIDGLINEPVWNIVEWTGDYIENLPDENTPPIEQTKFKVVYDKDFIYFAFRCYDKNPKEIVRRLSRRDGFEGDWIEINISSHHDQLTAFSFAGSVAGVKSDGFISDNGKTWEGNWNPIWYLKTNIDSEGWTAEIKIPLSQLKFGDQPVQTWGLQSTRRYFRTEERSLWQRIPLDAPGWVSEFGELRGLENLSPHRQIEIQPFLFSKYQNYPAQLNNPFKTGRDFEMNGGLDAKIGITNDLTLNMTINPDFGQVEADPAAIALDGFQIFFQERRPFFVENKNIFDYQFADEQDNLFYSRRIGRNPTLYPSVGNNAFVNIPDNTSILGAAKFGGKTRKGWSLGILESLTGNEFARIDEVGSRRKTLIEPLSNYFITRTQKDFNNRNSTAGFIFTATNRKLDAFTADYLHSAAFTGGADLRHTWNNRKYYIKANAVFSQVSGNEKAIAATQKSIVHLFQREDSEKFKMDTTRIALTGSGGNFEIGKASEGNWKYSLAGMWRSPELELNDMGFLRTANDIKQTASVVYSTLKPFAGFRKIETRFEQSTGFDFQRNFNRLHFSLATDAVFKNNWNAGISAVYKPLNYSNSALQGGPRFRYSREFYKNMSFFSDSRKKFRSTGGITDTRADDGSFSYTSFSTGFVYQPVNAFSASFNPAFNLNKNELQYVNQADGPSGKRYILARINQKSLSASFRFDYSINPDLTIQYYAQPFISQGHYSRFKRVTSGLSAKYSDRFSMFSDGQINYSLTDGNYWIDEDQNGTMDYKFNKPDFSFVQYRSNLVIRWEYIPGSEMYAVWSQGITASAEPGRNLWEGLNNEIFGRKPSNIFLIKFTYRFIL